MSRFSALAESDSESEAESSEDSSPISSTDLEALKERREDEIEAIAAIYGEDASCEKMASISEIQVRLRIAPDTGELNYADVPLECTLIIGLGSYYPRSSPKTISIENWPKQFEIHTPPQELKTILLKTCETWKGEEVLQQLYDNAVDFLNERSHAKSLHGSMKTRIAETEKQERTEKQEDEMLRKAQEEADRKKRDDEWAETIDRKLEEELEAKRKAQTKQQQQTTGGRNGEESNHSHEGDDSDEGPPPGTTSRFLTEYRVMRKLGQGGGGQVIKVRNRLDKRYYAVKIIRPKSRKILRELLTLSRLYHPNIVRYYSAWQEGCEDRYHGMDEEEEDSELETSEDEEDNDSESEGFWQQPSGGDIIIGGEMESWDEESASNNEDLNFDFGNEWGDLDAVDENDNDEEKKTAKKSSSLSPKAKGKLPTFVGRGDLYIQMEYCDRDLRALIDAGQLNLDEAWRLLRQILEALEYIHSKGIIHRDLKPANVFLDAKGDVKVGDFGLAVERPDHHPEKELDKQYDFKSNLLKLDMNKPVLDSVDTAAGVINQASESEELTGGVGTTLYRAPEQDALRYSKKVDIWALGIVFFEMLTKFSTGMERVNTLIALRERCEFPQGFEEDFPDACKVLRLCCAHDAEKRPTATELLMSGLLPSKMEMESEYLEQALAVTCNHRSASFPLLVNRLFSQPARPHIDFLWEANASLLTEARKRECCVELLKHVFATHHCTYLVTPLLRPRSGIFDPPVTASAVEFLSHDGEIALLPTNLSAPIARYMAQLRRPRIKTYSFGNVFEPTASLEGIGGGEGGINSQPVEHLEASFNMVDCNAKSSPLLAVECILVALSAARSLKRGMEMPTLTTRLDIGDSQLMPSLLQLCGCRLPPLQDTHDLYNRIWSFMNVPSSSLPTSAASVLKREGVDDEAVSHLFRTLPSDALRAIAELENRVDWVFRTRSKKADSDSNALTRSVRLAWESFGRMREVCEVLSVLGAYDFEAVEDGIELREPRHQWSSSLNRQKAVVDSIYLDLSLIDHHDVFDSGLLFHVYLEVIPKYDRIVRTTSGSSKDTHMSKKILIGEGGSFADLLAVFRRPPVRRTDPTVGMGLRIPLDRIAKECVLTEPGNAFRVNTSQCFAPTVLIAALSDGSIGNDAGGGLERLYVAHLLWEADIRSEHLLLAGPSGRSVETLSTECRRKGVAHLVLVKPHLLHREGMVKVVNLNHPHPHLATVHVNELTKRILNTHCSPSQSSSSSSSSLSSRCGDHDDAITSLSSSASSQVKTTNKVYFVGKPDSGAVMKRISTLLGPLFGDSTVLVVDSPHAALRRISSLIMDAGKEDSINAVLAEYPTKYHQTLKLTYDKLVDYGSGNIEGFSDERKKQFNKKEKSGAGAVSPSLSTSPVILFSSLENRFDLVYFDSSDVPKTRNHRSGGKKLKGAHRGR